MSLYIDGSRAVKQHSRPHLVGTAHKPGWREHVRAFRAQLKALYPSAPADTKGAEAMALELIDHVDRLSPQARHIHRLALAELVKLSN